MFIDKLIWILTNSQLTLETTQYAQNGRKNVDFENAYIHVSFVRTCVMLL